MEGVLEIYGKNTFNDSVMQAKLPKDVYKKLKATVKTGSKLDPEIANTVAHAMKEWAIENGASHFTHWFQPLTDATAEKHDAFLDINGDGDPIQRFSGNMLIQGEPDASSFPSGGMRATFEARGYTIWDTSSPAFINEGPAGNTLCIPTVFISYNGEALDKKTPLLRSMRALDKAAKKLIKVFGREVSRVTTTLGPEQEYFLVDQKLYEQRPDLMLAGRTVIGAPSPKGQELEDHYFGSIKERVLEFMQITEKELYKLGIPAKTRHNEVAPHQFEIAPIFGEANIAADRNQQVMEVLRKTATRLGLALLLHEKPFAGINGSGKHLNWSLVDSDDNNLLDPGHTPKENLQFLVVLVSVLKAVKDYSKLLRASIASTGNDHRLGANEAPPAIISVFLGTTLSNILDAIEEGKDHITEDSIIDLGLEHLPTITKDNTDRNRTSPFAFTGNKFEFRALGSSCSISFPATILNAATAETFTILSNEIEAAVKGGSNLNVAVISVLKKYITETKTIRFNGDNYTEDWVKEAEKRGLPNLKNTAASLPAIVAPESIKMLTSLNVLTEAELHSRYNTKLEKYCKVLAIEYNTMASMAKTMVLPAALDYQNKIISAVSGLSAAGINSASQKKLLQELAGEIDKLYNSLGDLEKVIAKAQDTHDELKKTEFIASKVVPVMNEVRLHCDTLETLVPDSEWPLPKYRELLFLM
jgi:glutamine synthetase